MIVSCDFFLKSQNLLTIKDFFKHKNLYVFSLNIDLIFLTQNWSVFSLNTNLIFVTQLQILKFKRRDWKLGWSLFFFLICDACIMNLSHECESSFKSLFYFMSNNKSDFFINQKSLLFFFLLYTKTYLIFSW